MGGLLFAPLAVFFELDFALYPLAIFATPVVDPLAIFAG